MSTRYWDNVTGTIEIELDYLGDAIIDADGRPLDDELKDLLVQALGLQGTGVFILLEIEFESRGRRTDGPYSGPETTEHRSLRSMVATVDGQEIEIDSDIAREIYDWFEDQINDVEIEL